VTEREKIVRVAQLPRGREWADALVALAKQLDAGRLYDRDIDDVAAAAVKVYEALERRLRYRDRRSHRSS
jgi:hypothetical protein